MVKHYLDPNWEERFWDRIHENCPDLIRAIDVSFNSDAGWGRITFTRNICSPAFDPSLIEADQEELQASAEEKTMNPYTESVKCGADLLDRVRPGWRAEINRSTLNSANGQHCILGQLFGYYNNGLIALLRIDVSSHADYAAWYDSPDFQTVLAHGFIVDVLKALDDDAEWTALQEAWIAELDGSPTNKEKGE
jgi:hypothetical protein